MTLSDHQHTEGLDILHILARALRGGVEKNCLHFIDACPQFRHEVVVLDSEGPMIADLEAVGARVRVLDILRKGRLGFHLDLPVKLPPGNFQRIIAWTNIRMPVVMHALNKYNAEIYVHIGNPVNGGLSEWMQSLLFPSSNTIHLRPVSAYVQRGLRDHPYYRRFSSKVSLKPLVIPDTIVKEPEGVSEQAIVNFGMVARLDPIKDHRTVILAFRILHEEYPASVLNLVGNGSLMDALKNLVAENNLDSSVKFHGEAVDVYAKMQGWDLFLYATTSREGLGGTIPEALSIGLPVVATDLPMIREWDAEGKYITFCKPGDPQDMALKASRLLSNTARRKEIRRDAPAYIRAHFSPEIFSYNYISNG